MLSIDKYINCIVWRWDVRIVWGGCAGGGVEVG